MTKYLLLCRSLTYAQRAARLLERSGISALVLRAPTGVSDSGCGYCVKVSEKRLAPALKVLREGGLGPLRVFVIGEDGSFSEVSP